MGLLSKEDFLKLAPTEQIALAQGPKPAPLSKEEFLKLPPEEQKALAGGEAKPPPKGELDTFGKFGSAARSVLEGHTAGISEPVVSAVKAAADSYTSGKPFKEAFHDDVEQRKAEKQANPGLTLANEVTGAILPSPVNVVGKITRGASALAKFMGLAGKTLPQAMARGAVIGATGAGGTQAVKLAAEKPFGLDDSNVPSSLATAIAGGGVLGAVAEPIAGAIASKTSPKLKANAAEIQKAGRELGVKPTIGQLTDSKFVQGMESSLTQSPHMGAGATKASVDAARQATKDTAELLLSDAAQNTRTEIGHSVRKGVVDKIAKEIEPAEKIYQGLEDKLKQMPATVQNAAMALNELEGIARVNGEMRTVTSGITKDLQNVKTVSDLKNFRTGVNLQLKGNVTDLQRMALTRIKTAINADRSESLVNGAEAAGIPHAQELLEAADGIYARAARTAQESLPIHKGTGPKGVGHALDKINDTALADKAFNVRDVNRLESMKANFPREFEQLRQNRVRNILDSVTHKGEVSTTALIREVDKLEPEAKNLIFGDGGAKKIDALKTFIHAFPDKVGPSGTPQGLEFLHFIKGLMTGAPVANRARQGAMQFIGNRAIEGMPSAAERTLYVAPGALGSGAAADAVSRRLQK